jgi:hypothetical protein
MCCGKNRLPKSFMQTQALPTKVVSPPSAPKPASASVKVTVSAVRQARFVYGGSTGLTVVSPITGRRYRFERTGAQVDVDPRDRAWISFVPKLRAV